MRACATGDAWRERRRDARQRRYADERVPCLSRVAHVALCRRGRGAEKRHATLTTMRSPQPNALEFTCHARTLLPYH